MPSPQPLLWNWIGTIFIRNFGLFLFTEMHQINQTVCCLEVRSVFMLDKGLSFDRVNPKGTFSWAGCSWMLCAMVCPWSTDLNKNCFIIILLCLVYTCTVSFCQFLLSRRTKRKIDVRLAVIRNWKVQPAMTQDTQMN